MRPSARASLGREPVRDDAHQHRLTVQRQAAPSRQPPSSTSPSSRTCSARRSMWPTTSTPRPSPVAAARPRRCASIHSAPCRRRVRSRSARRAGRGHSSSGGVVIACSRNPGSSRQQPAQHDHPGEGRGQHPPGLRRWPSGTSPPARSDSAVTTPAPTGVGGSRGTGTGKPPAAEQALRGLHRVEVARRDVRRVQLHDELAPIAQPQAVDAADARLEERRGRDRRADSTRHSASEGPGDLHRRCVAERRAARAARDPTRRCGPGSARPSARRCGSSAVTRRICAPCLSPRARALATLRGRCADSAPPLTFQDLIIRLQAFWGAQGCVIVQPYHTEVGAGTFNPATFLRALGPSRGAPRTSSRRIRPDRRPLRREPLPAQHYYQYQVLLKPSPPDVQEVYLASLEAIGIDPAAARHALRRGQLGGRRRSGAWGTGWEVWIDGMEVTQFTYFQQAGGIDLDPDLRRAHVRPRAARDVPAGRRLRLRPGVGAGRHLRRRLPRERAPVLDLQLRGRRRRPCSCASSDDQRGASAAAAWSAGCRCPPTTRCCKCSHAFNLLDARGAISVTERVAYIARVRNLARAVAAGVRRAALAASRATPRPPREADLLSSSAARSCRQDACGVADADAAAVARATGWSASACSAATSRRYVSPRRIAVLAARRAVRAGRRSASSTAARRRTSRATTTAGRRRPRASRGATALDRRRPGAARRLRLGRRRRRRRRRSPSSRRASSTALVDGLQIPKNMRWGSETLRFARPIRTLVVLHGERRCSTPRWPACASGRTVRGHRFVAAGARAGRAPTATSTRSRAPASSCRPRAARARSSARRSTPPRQELGADVERSRRRAAPRSSAPGRAPARAAPARSAPSAPASCPTACS